MARAILELHLTVDAANVAQAAAAMKGRLETCSWEILVALAAEILARHEAASGSQVIVVPADQQTAAVARALGVPALVK